MLNKRRLLIFIFVFMISLIWFSSLTYNFNYFWEDPGLLGIYDYCSNHPEESSFISYTSTFLRKLIYTNQFIMVRYTDLPLTPHTYACYNLYFHKLLYPLLEQSVIDHIVKSAIFSLIVASIFFFFY